MKYILIVWLGVLSFNSHSQDCLSGSISMSSSDVDNFPVNYPNCRNIVGNVLIDNATSVAGFAQLDQWEGTLYLRSYEGADLYGLHNIDTIGGFYIPEFMSPLTNIDHLSQIEYVTQYLDVRGHELVTEIPTFEHLTRIEGDLQITNMNGVKAINAFNNLEYLGTQIQIRYNDLLERLSGFSKLDSIGTSLALDGNKVLDTLDGFKSLEYLGGDLNLFYMDSIQQFDTFDSLDYVGGIVQVFGNDVMTDLPAFGELDSIGTGILIGLNPELQSLGDLPALQSLRGNMYIVQNPRLKEIDGLSSVVDNDGFINIDTNDSLMTISGLSNFIADKITTNSGDYLTLTNNPLLDYCSVKSICELIDIPTAVLSISNNGANCGDVSAIDAECCPSELVLDGTDPLISGIYESLNNILLLTDIPAGVNIELRHGPGSEVKLSQSVAVDPTATITISDLGCEY